MTWAAAGSALMFLAVVLGAFAAHGLKSHLSADMLAIFEVGVRYQVYHSLGLFVVAWLSEKTLTPSAGIAGILFFIGIALFSGSLYALSLTGVRWLGVITPLGGLCFLAGWAWLAYVALRSRA